MATHPTQKPKMPLIQQLNKISRPSLSPYGIAVSFIFFTGLSAPFDTMSAEFSPQVWLTPGIYAWHFDRSKDLRDENPGFGVEIALAEDHIAMGGTYINSNRDRTHYVAYQFRPLHWKFDNFNMGAGIVLGAFDGYPGYRDGGWFVAPLPVLSVEGRYLGFNFGIVPTIPNRLDGALAIQIKLRVW